MSKKVYVDRENLIDLFFSVPYDVLSVSLSGSANGGGFSRQKIVEIINSVPFIVEEEGEKE